MSRLIDADALKARTKAREKNGFTEFITEVLCGLIDKAESVDAVEVKHGEWLRYGEDGNPNSIDTCIWQCDKCLETYYGRTERIPNYCPHCGAKMDGEVKDE